MYPAEKISEIPSDQNIVVTFGDSILPNIKCIQCEDDISYCTNEEDGQRIVRHVINCAKNSLSLIVVCTGDTDVLILLISTLHLLQDDGLISMIYIEYLVMMCANALPFFHAFTGSDTVSSF